MPHTAPLILDLAYFDHHHLQYEQFGDRDVNKVAQGSVTVDQWNLRGDDNDHLMLILIIASFDHDSFAFAFVWERGACRSTLTHHGHHDHLRIMMMIDDHKDLQYAWVSKRSAWRLFHGSAP